MTLANQAAAVGTCTDCEKSLSSQAVRRMPQLHPLYNRESAKNAADTFRRIAERNKKCSPSMPEGQADHLSSGAVPETSIVGIKHLPRQAAKYAPSSTRLNYDVDAYQHSLRESVAPGGYWIGTPTQECVECFPTDPRMTLAASGNAKCVDRPLVDVDSELHGITRKASKNPALQFKPDGGRHHKCHLARMPACRDSSVVAEDTRLSNPPCTLRGQRNGFNRWELLCRNPQANVDKPFDNLINNRLIVKDNHRPILPTPLDQTPILPPNSKDDGMITTMPSCVEGSAIAPSFPMATFQECKNVYH